MKYTEFFSTSVPPLLRGVRGDPSSDLPTPDSLLPTPYSLLPTP
ncbi:hypothetical protein [Moorena sp. SIOASIH]|nr:hypothetical protein [Moorena sp. SIOASIH]